MITVSIWDRKNHLPSAPDTACVCVELARKDGIAEVRAHLTDGLGADLTVDDWRRLAAKVVIRLKGL